MNDTPNRSEGNFEPRNPRRESGRPAGAGRPGRDSRPGDRENRGDRRPASGDRRPATGEDRGRGRGARQEGNRPAWQQLVARPRRDDAEKSPLIPEEIQPADLAMPVRAQLKTLTAENADMVARHLIMVQMLIDQDPELAHKHAKAAAARAGRIAVVRETIGITAYTIGDYALALRELMTFRRISGSNDQLPIMVDCERGLERPDRALELGRSVDRNALEPAVRVNLAIAMSGARLDRGETELALAELQIAELNPQKVFDYSPPLFWAYADVLEDLKRTDEAAHWASLGDRAAAALAAKSGQDEEVFEVLEEFNIPTAEERPKREDRGERSSFGDRDRGGDRDRSPRRDDRGGDRGGERGERRSFGERDGGRDERPRRNFGDGDSRSDRPRADRDSRSDRPDRAPRRDDRGTRDSAPREARAPREPVAPREVDPGSGKPLDSEGKPQVLDFGERPRTPREPRPPRNSGEKPGWKAPREDR